MIHVGRQVLWRIIRDLVPGGVTVLLTTQYLEEADRLGPEAVLVLIDRGALVAEGTPSELKRRTGTGRTDPALFLPGMIGLAAEPAVEFDDQAHDRSGTLAVRPFRPLAA